MNKKAYFSLFGAFYLTAVLFFLWGTVAGNYKIFPWKYMAAVYEELHSYISSSKNKDKKISEQVTMDHQEFPSQYDFTGFRNRDSAFIDNGYLLISRYSKEHGQAIIELFSISKNKKIYSWLPSRKEMYESTREIDFPSDDPLTTMRFRAIHPLLLKNGHIIFNTAPPGPMVSIDQCGDVIWMNKRIFHHSTEIDQDGNILTPTIIEGIGNTTLPIRDDGFAIITPDGKILNEYSVTDILIDNGYRGLIYGVGNFEKDRIHLNDVQPVLYNTVDAKAGDVLLSIRHLSSVALFSPESGKIKWLKTGPWLNQHDIDHIGNSWYSIFGNNVVRKGHLEGNFLEEKYSNIYLYNPTTGEIQTPYTDVMKREKIATKTEGRSRILPNGDVFIEESNASRLLRISKDKVRWEYVNSLTPDTVGTVNWSRYLLPDEINLKWMENISCN